MKEKLFVGQVLFTCIHKDNKKWSDLNDEEKQAYAITGIKFSNIILKRSEYVKLKTMFEEFEETQLKE